MAELFWASLATPVGPVSIGASGAGVAQVRYGVPPPSAGGDRTQDDRTRDDGHGDDRTRDDGHGDDRTGDDGHRDDRAGDDGGGRELAEAARRQLTEYFSGRRREFDLPLDWSFTGGAQRDVLQVLAESVGYGETIRYGQLATRAGLTATAETVPARAVGQIMGSNPIPVIVPCHRVLASDGLGGYSGGAGVEVKRWLLILEGSVPPTLDWRPMHSPT